MNLSSGVPKPTSFASLTFLQMASGLLILTLGFTTGCKKKDPPPAQLASSKTSHSKLRDASYLPQDIFGPDPQASVLAPARKLSGVRPSQRSMNSAY